MPSKKQVILLLLFTVCSISLFRRLLESYMVTVTKYVPLSHISLPFHGNIVSFRLGMIPKEARFLQEFITSRVPCNILIFGYADQYSSIASMNSRGNTVILEDEFEKSMPTVPKNCAKVHKIMYTTVAAEAYQFLKEARESPDCFREFYQPNVSRCKLALTNLPSDVYDTLWDVILVDGPRGDSVDSPGRMASIYTAGSLARRGNGSHVIVHDIDRMIERWFSWEFLCENNLVSSKGRFWHFYIPPQLINRKAFVYNYIKHTSLRSLQTFKLYWMEQIMSPLHILGG